MYAAGRALLNLAFLFALTIWGGMVFFFTFVNTPVIFDSLDRDTAARLLGELFPRYFRVQVACIVVALAAVAARSCAPLGMGAPPRRLAGVAAGLLTVALALALYTSAVLLPRLAEAQARVPSFVTTPRDDPARQAYGRLHGRAMALNGVAALLGGATLALAACEPRLLARRDERRPAPEPRESASAAGARVGTPLRETKAGG